MVPRSSGPHRAAGHSKTNTQLRGIRNGQREAEAAVVGPRGKECSQVKESTGVNSEKYLSLGLKKIIEELNKGI